MTHQDHGRHGVASDRECPNENRRDGSAEQIRQLVSLGEQSAETLHEICQPVIGVLWFAEHASNQLDELQAHPTDEGFAAVQETIEIIRVQAQTIHSILSRANDDSASPQRDADDCDVGQVINRVRPLANVLAQLASVAIEIDIEENSPQVSIASTELVQVLTNLLKNAIDAVSACPQDRRRVRVRVFMATPDVMLEVRDWGEGIEEESLQQVFDRRYTTRASGSGLGLTISRDILKACGGGIHISRNADHGVTATVRLPISS